MEINSTTRKTSGATIFCGVPFDSVKRTITVMETIHARIRRLREAKGLSKAALAKASGATYQAVQSWERGDTAPKRARLSAVAAALGVSPHELALGAPIASQTPVNADCRLAQISSFWEWLTDHQRSEIVSEIKSMAEANKAIARQFGGKVSIAPNARVEAALKSSKTPKK